MEGTKARVSRKSISKLKLICVGGVCPYLNAHFEVLHVYFF
uniref:SD02241p n=1 Tax=Drosophila melanogaster TaxID=7227 RepID=Q95SW7_DROME|nr:SD02241p [Drosophila melanogaster]